MTPPHRNSLCPSGYRSDIPSSPAPHPPSDPSGSSLPRPSPSTIQSLLLSFFACCLRGIWSVSGQQGPRVPAAPSRGRAHTGHSLCEQTRGAPLQSTGELEPRAAVGHTCLPSRSRGWAAGCHCSSAQASRLTAAVAQGRWVAWGLDSGGAHRPLVPQVPSDRLGTWFPCRDGKVVGGPAERGPQWDSHILSVWDTLPSCSRKAPSTMGSGPSFRLPHPRCFPHPDTAHSGLPLSGEGFVSPVGL